AIAPSTIEEQTKEATTSTMLTLGAILFGDHNSHLQFTKDILFTNSLNVLGDTLLGNTNVAGDLSIGGNVRINSTSINSEAGVLAFQKNKLFPIDLMNGGLTIDTQGNVTAGTNLRVSGIFSANAIASTQTND